MSELKIGDVVQLKSGGPKMTIDTIDTPAIGFVSGEDVVSSDTLHAWVSWMDNDGKRQKDDFPLTSLKIFTPKKRGAVTFRAY